MSGLWFVEVLMQCPSFAYNPRDKHGEYYLSLARSIHLFIIDKKTMQQQEEQNQAFNIELPDEISHGIYSNLAVVMHSQSEFVLDFVRLLPGKQTAQVHSRVIMTPDNIKRLVRVLQQNIYTYEQECGAINLPEDSQVADSSFPQGEA